MSKRNRKNGGLVTASQSRTSVPRREPDSPPRAEDKGAPPPAKSTRQHLWKGWQVFWAFAGPIMAVIGFWIAMTPTISIEPGVNIDLSQTYSTQIVVTNRGHVPIYDVTFRCGIGVGGGLLSVEELTTRGQDLRPVRILHSGEAVTKSCAVSSKVGGNNKISFTASFTWPLIGNRDSKQAFFEVKEGPGSHFLVPSDAP